MNLLTVEELHARHSHLEKQVKETLRKLEHEKFFVSNLKNQLEAAQLRVQGMEFDAQVFQDALENSSKMGADPAAAMRENFSHSLRDLADLRDREILKNQMTNPDPSSGKDPSLYEAMRILTSQITPDTEPVEVESNPIPAEKHYISVVKSTRDTDKPFEVPEPHKVAVVANKVKGKKSREAKIKFGHKGFGNKKIEHKKD